MLSPSQFFFFFSFVCALGTEPTLQLISLAVICPSHRAVNSTANQRPLSTSASSLILSNALFLPLLPHSFSRTACFCLCCFSHCSPQNATCLNCLRNPLIHDSAQCASLVHSPFPLSFLTSARLRILLPSPHIETLSWRSTTAGSRRMTSDGTIGAFSSSFSGTSD